MEKEIMWVKPQNFVRAGIEQIIQTEIVLDIGCGIHPHIDYMTPHIYICCEPYKEYVDVLKEKLQRNTDSIFLILQLGWEEAVEAFKEKSVDTVYLIDVIEHLEKETGHRLLKMTEKIAKYQVIIFTPLGFQEQKRLPGNKDAWGLDGADWQEHKSGWFPEDFDDSWKIIACENYHSQNNVGEKLEKPFGAFWAIRNIRSEGQDSALFFNNKQMLALYYEKSVEVFNMLKHKEKSLIARIEQLENERVGLPKSVNGGDKTKIICWGAGEHYKRHAAWIHHFYEVVALCDNNAERIGTELFGVPVIKPDRLAEYACEKILVTVIAPKVRADIEVQARDVLPHCEFVYDMRIMHRDPFPFREYYINNFK